MAEAIDVREDEPLSAHIDLVDVGAVNNQTATNADKILARRTQLFANHTLNLTELKGERADLVVGLVEQRVVAVRRKIDNPFGRNADQFGRGRYDKVACHWLFRVANLASERRIPKHFGGKCTKWVVGCMKWGLAQPPKKDQYAPSVTENSQYPS